MYYSANYISGWGTLALINLAGDWGRGNVWRIVSGVFSSNSYFCEIGGSGDGFLIDPGLDGAAIDEILVSRNLTPSVIFCTHGHFDHTGSALFFQEKYGCQVFLNRYDKKTTKSSNFLLMLLKIKIKITNADFTLVDSGFEYNFDGICLRFRSAPGHTPGSCILEFGNVWFTGDTIYAKGVGLSGLPGEDKEMLRCSILQLWDEMREHDRLICPGHGVSSDGLKISHSNTQLLDFLRGELG